MATYSIKLVDHTGSANDVTKEIQSNLKGYFDRVFSGTSDSATVVWGAASTSDTIIVRFVADVAGSYIAKKMDRPPTLESYIGGHTTKRGKTICSEVYKAQVDSRGKARKLTNLDYAKLAFHECLHNVLPGWDESDFNGHGGLAATPCGADLIDRDKELMRKGIGIPANYKQLV